MGEKNVGQDLIAFQVFADRNPDLVNDESKEKKKKKK